MVPVVCAVAKTAEAIKIKSIEAGLQNNSTTRLVVELKPSGISKERAKQSAEKAVQLVKRLKAEAMIVYISFDYDILKKIRAIDPKTSLQYLEGNKSPKEVKADKINGVDYHYSVFQKHPEWIQEAKDNFNSLKSQFESHKATQMIELKEREMEIKALEGNFKQVEERLDTKAKNIEVLKAEIEQKDADLAIIRENLEKQLKIISKKKEELDAANEIRIKEL